MFKSRTCVEATWEDAGAGAGESRHRRRRRQVPAPVPAPAPGLHHDHGQITTSVVLLGVQVMDVRTGYLGGRRLAGPGLHHDCSALEATWEDAGAGAGKSRRPWRRRPRDYTMTMARSQPLVVHLGVQVTDVHRGYLGGRRRRRRDYIMTMARSQPL